MNLNVIYVGEVGFPYGFAAIQRALLICRGLVEMGARVTVISRKGVHVPQQGKIDAEGCFEGVHYVFASGTAFRSRNMLVRNLLKVKGLLNEIMLTKRLRAVNGYNVMIVSTMDLLDFMYYTVLARRYGYVVVMNYVEYNPAVCVPTTMRGFINRYAFESYAIRSADGVMPISEFLASSVKRKYADKPCLMVPVLCDYNKFPSLEEEEREPYFLYCGSTAYFEVCTFVIRAFTMVKNDTAGLHMVVNGEEHAIEKLRRIVQATARGSRIHILTDLPYDKLVEQYQNATGLLIPLRPSIQDSARFPHKIGEYTAANRPIITTNVGEVRNFFEDGRTAFIAGAYDEAIFADKMDFVLSQHTLAQHVAENAKDMGYRLFHYQHHAQSIYSFILSLQH